MKRKKFLTLFFILISIELVIIIGLKGYGVIHDILSMTDSNQPGSSKISSKKNPSQDKNKEGTVSEISSSEDIEETPESSSSIKNHKFITVDDTYFDDDCLFIGDSRTVALRAFGSFPNSFFFAKTGINVNGLFEYPANDELTGQTLRFILNQRKYNKIYIMIGVNDLSYGTLNSFSDSYFAVIDKIREYQPDALIYVQSIIGITKWKENGSPRDFNNQTVINRNAILQSKCDGENVIYLDLFSAYMDKEGYLDKQYSSDGLHITPSSLYIWEEYLKTHAIDR